MNGFVASSSAIVDGTVGSPAPNHGRIASALLQFGVRRFDGEREADVGQRVLVGTVHARRGGSSDRRSSEASICVGVPLEEPPAAAGKQRVAAERTGGSSASASTRWPAVCARHIEDVEGHAKYLDTIARREQNVDAVDGFGARTIDRGPGRSRGRKAARMVAVVMGD
jgi:hypothetical protein